MVHYCDSESAGPTFRSSIMLEKHLEMVLKLTTICAMPSAMGKSDICSRTASDHQVLACEAHQVDRAVSRRANSHRSVSDLVGSHAVLETTSPRVDRRNGDP